MVAWVGASLFGSYREMVFRAAVVYFFLLILFRIAGARTLAALTSFDMVLLLILSEAAQPALTGPEQPKLMGALTSVVTLVALDILFSFAKQRFSAVGTFIDGRPLILVVSGKPIRDRLDSSRVTVDEILAAAREQGCAQLSDIDYAVLEVNGRISIIPCDPAPPSGDSHGKSVTQ